MAALLEVRRLRVEFDTRARTLVALNDVSFDVVAGEVLGLVGESGAGKSVTGAAITGLLEPPGRIASGEVHFDGMRVDVLPERDLRRLRGRQIATIFQDPLTSLNPVYTVGRQIVETIRAHLPVDRREARQRAAALLRATGVPAALERLEQYPHQFSGGMRQRVVIALALAAQPRLLIADEPTTALDVSTQAQVTAMLRRNCDDSGTSMLLITHDMGLIAEMCDRVAVMYAGRIVEIGPVADVLHAPMHPYTVGLMNAIPTIDGDQDRLALIDGAMPTLRSIPAGCPFHLRCPRRLPRCDTESPPTRVRSNSRVACWLYDEVQGDAA